MTEVCIKTPTIRLDAFLKLCGAADSGGAAKYSVQTGLVHVNHEVCTQRGKQLRAGDTVTTAGRHYLVQQAANPVTANEPGTPEVPDQPEATAPCTAQSPADTAGKQTKQPATESSS